MGGSVWFIRQARERLRRQLPSPSWRQRVRALRDRCWGCRQRRLRGGRPNQCWHAVANLATRKRRAASRAGRRGRCGQRVRQSLHGWMAIVRIKSNECMHVASAFGTLGTEERKCLMRNRGTQRTEHDSVDERQAHVDRHAGEHRPEFPRPRSGVPRARDRERERGCLVGRFVGVR